LRVYDETDMNGMAFFEVKQKHKKVVNKRRMLLPLYEAKRYLSNDYSYPLEEYETSNEQVLSVIHYFRQLYQLRPEMIVSYDRHALQVIEDAELRMTFDFNLRCRHNDLSLENGAYGISFIKPDLVIIEVNVNDRVH